MKRRIELMAAPPSIQPGGYIRQAYADRTEPATPWADLVVEPRGSGWHVLVSWACAEQSTRTRHDVNLFSDACAILAPAAPDAPMMTMGSATAAVDGWLWHADRESSVRVTARGLGSVERLEPAAGTQVAGVWSGGRWAVSFELPAWDSLRRQQLIGVAVWQGVAAERAGLKSVSTNWIPIQ